MFCAALSIILPTELLIAGPGSTEANTSLTELAASVIAFPMFPTKPPPPPPPPSRVMPRENGPLTRGENALIGSADSKPYLIREPSTCILVCQNLVRQHQVALITLKFVEFLRYHKLFQRQNF